MVSHRCPSRSWKPCPYIHPWSCFGLGIVAPACCALLTSSSTASLLLADNARMASVLLVASATCFLVNVLKNFSTSSITNMSSLTIMHAPWLLVKCVLKLNPSRVKKSIDLLRSFTGKFTNILVDMTGLFGLAILHSRVTQQPSP